MLVYCHIPYRLTRLEQIASESIPYRRPAGLMNSLAGTFMTPIVSLARADGFLLLEKSSWHAVVSCHRGSLRYWTGCFQNKSRKEREVEWSQRLRPMVELESKKK